MNIIINSESVLITEKSKKIESGWAVGDFHKMQLHFSFFETGSANVSHDVSDIIPPTK